MPKLLVFTVDDRPRHVGADRAMTALLGAFTFAPVVYRQSRGPVVTFHAEIPDVQLEALPTAVDALRAIDEVVNIAVVTLPDGEDPPEPATHSAAETAGSDGASVRHQP